MKTIRRFLILLFLISINFTGIYGQRTIKGRIIDENLDELISARIYDSTYNLLGEADFNGFFEIIISNENNKLVFGFIGYENANVELSDSCNYVEIILLSGGGCYLNTSNRKIDRLRRKDFDNLSQLHLEAVKKGIFKNEIICYSREFEPIKSRLDEIGREVKARKRQITKDYQSLSVGDTVIIPFSGGWRDRETDQTILYVWSSVTDTERFDCLIEGVVIKKYRNRYRSPRFPWVSLRKGYDFTFRVTNCENCKFISPIYGYKAMEVGQEFEHDMRILKAIIKKNASR